MEPFMVSLSYYILVFVFCELSRQVVDRITSAGSTLRLFLYEFIGTLQVCTTVYENGLVLKHYGVAGFMVTVVCLIISHSLLNRGAVIVPCAAFERMLYGGSGLGRFLVHLTGQLAGGYMAFRLARQLWWLGISAEHVAQFSNFPCKLGFKAPFLIRCAYELAGNFLIRTALGQVSLKNKKFVAAAMTSIGLSIELTFLGPPGLNPIIASSRLLGCEGMSTQAHLAVYWLSPLIGWFSAASLEGGRNAALQKKAE